MKERIAEIRKLLISHLDSNKLMDDIAYGFFERVNELEKPAPIFSRMLWEYDSFLEYFEAKNEELNATEQILLEDMREGIEEEISDAFDHAEDATMEELLSSQWEKQIRQDFDAQGITLYPGAPLSPDQIEELYVEAYRSFDRFHQQFLDKVLTLSPQKAYNQGQQRVANFRKANGLNFDEDDFLALFDERFRTEELDQLLTEKVQMVINYSRHYELVLPEEWDDEEEDQEAIYDGIMENAGDMKDQGFTYVSELMNEYTGRRVLATDNDMVEEPYWTTYGEDFRDLILQFVETELETMIQYLEKERTEDFAALAAYLKLSEVDRTDLAKILETSDKINFGMGDRVEDLWEAFCQRRI